MSNSPERKFITALYGRTSKDDPRRVTIEIQQNVLKDWATRDSLVERVVDEYWDDGVTGKLPLWQRPEGKRLLADVDAGRIQSVAVAYADRFGRTLLDGLNAVKLLEDKGVKLIAVNDGWDARRNDSPLYFQFRMMMAEEEHRRICQRMSSGKARAMDRDNAPPGGPLTFGYRIDSGGRFVPDPQESAVVIRMFQMILEGHTQSDILRWVITQTVKAGRKFQKRLAGSSPTVVNTHAGAKWHITKVSKILRNKTYLGTRTWSDRTFPCVPLVDQATFDKVQVALSGRALANNFLFERGDPSKGLLSGLLVCGSCGSKFYHQLRSSRRAKGTVDGYHMYTCDNARRGKGCMAKLLRVDRLDEEVWSLVVNALSDPVSVVRRVVQADRELHSEQSSLDQQEQEHISEIDQVDTDVKAAWEMKRANNYPMSFIKDELDRLNAKRASAEESLKVVRAKRAEVSLTREQSGEVTAYLADIRAKLSGEVSAEVKADIIRKVVAGCVVETRGVARQKSADIVVSLRWGETVNSAEQLASRKLPKDWSYGNLRHATLDVTIKLK